jgi:hypothetical protein
MSQNIEAQPNRCLKRNEQLNTDFANASTL